MLIKEYRIPMPLTVPEYQRGQLFTILESESAGRGRATVSHVRTEPFQDVLFRGGSAWSGQLTYKKLSAKPRLSRLTRALAPRGSTEFHQMVWNAFPYVRTVLSNPDYLKDRFVFTIESIYLPGTRDQENPFQLSPAELAARQVSWIDIGYEPAGRGRAQGPHPRKFRSKAAGRGPLLGNWTWGTEPMMTVYKLITVQVKVPGLQRAAERMLHDLSRQGLLDFHQQLFCGLDRWYAEGLADLMSAEDRLRTRQDWVMLEEAKKRRGGRA